MSDLDIGRHLKGGGMKNIRMWGLIMDDNKPQMMRGIYNQGVLVFDLKKDAQDERKCRAEPKRFKVRRLIISWD